VALSLADIRVFFEVDLSDPRYTFYFQQQGNDGYTGAAAVNVGGGGLESLRKASVIFRRLSGGAEVDDEMQLGFHLLAVNDDGEPLEWDAARFGACETAIATWWGALKAHYMNTTTHKHTRWHRAGPTTDPPNTPGPKVREVAGSGAGTLTSGNAIQMPHEVACAVTERTLMRKRWGRFYLPSPVAAKMTADARWQAGFLTAVADATATLYGAFLAASAVPVVYSKAAPARSTRRGHTLPPKPATALKVNTLQVDDLPDTIRSRGLKHVGARERRGLAVT
jgi:hypothetical protein